MNILLRGARLGDIDWFQGLLCVGLLAFKIRLPDFEGLVHAHQSQTSF